MRFFRSPEDLAGWVKGCGSAEKAARILVNLPKVGEANVADVVETTKRIVAASDGNAAEVLYGILKSAGIVDGDMDKVEQGVDMVEAADEMLRRKLVTADAHQKMVKEAQIMRQPGEYNMPLRLCPKLPWSVGKKLISTYNCRHYCLDGIVLDDDPARVYCGELLWRRHMMDKFSSDFQDRQTGELIGGYINERFYKFPDAGTPGNPNVPRDGGHPMMLKPGERSRQPRPHQWSTERRMQEARKKGSGTDIVLNKTASGWLGRMVEAQASFGSRGGRYVDFSFDGQGNLLMTPTPDGIETAKELVEKGDTSDQAFLDMIEDHLANGWEIVAPEEIGALTSALIISNDVERNDQGELKGVGTVWSNINFYQVRSELQDFAEGKPVTWTKHESEEGKTASTNGKVVEAKAQDTASLIEEIKKYDPQNIIAAFKRMGDETAGQSTPQEIIEDLTMFDAYELMDVLKVLQGFDTKNPKQGRLPLENIAGTANKVVEAEKKGKSVNPWAVCNKSLGKGRDPDKFERCVLDVKEKHPVKKSEEEVAKEVFASSSQPIRLTAEVVKATEGDGAIVDAFKMAVDLHNEGASETDSILKISEKTGLAIEAASRIRSVAVRKMAAKVSDVYSVKTPEEADAAEEQAEKAKHAAEVQSDAADLGLIE